MVNVDYRILESIFYASKGMINNEYGDRVCEFIIVNNYDSKKDKTSLHIALDGNNYYGYMQDKGYHV